MINFLLDWLNIDKEPFFSAVKGYVRPTDRVCTVAFSFKDSQARCAEDWKLLYDGEDSYYYHRMTAPFTAHGISKDNISVVNYFEDTKEAAREKIESSDILVFPGGNVGRMMDRITEFDLYDTIFNYRGIIMGASAGAVIQLGEYHAPIYYNEYPEFRYSKGLGLVDGFYLEVHYKEAEAQKESLRRVLREREKPVYATFNAKGGIIVENGRVTPVGEVLRFDKEGDVI